MASVSLIISLGLPPDTLKKFPVHRDIKDENVVLGSHGKCILIDFGSSGLVKKTGWDTFSGTYVNRMPTVIVFVVVTEALRVLGLTTPDQKFSAANATLEKNKMSGRLEWWPMYFLWANARL